MFLLVLFVYFALLLGISLLTSRHRATGNDAFFLGNRRSPWWIVAIGMIGSSVSGVSFVSVPGMVRSIDFTYMQTVLGFFFGYLVIAKVLLPLYYRLGLTSIYTYLDNRLGLWSHKTGASFFLLSKLIGAAVRLYVVAIILQHLVLDALHVPFGLTVCGLVALIWLYTFRSGLKTIVWTDTLQTLCLVGALLLLIVQTMHALHAPWSELLSTAAQSGHMRLFVFDDWHSKQNFFKQFLSGVFIPIVMTGLDQDMMQKNLTCRSLRDAQKNMYWYGLSFVPVNALFLLLGALMLVFAQQNGIALPSSGDGILPLLATQYLGGGAALLFMIGLAAAAFSSADSALASLTTSFSVDILGLKNEDKNASRKRMIVHACIAVLFAAVILIFDALNSTSVIDAIYTIASYTYGPLLGMFAFGLFSKRCVRDRLVPLVAIVSPLACYALKVWLQQQYNYSMGYELLMLNGLLAFAGLFVLSIGRKQTCN